MQLSKNFWKNCEIGFINIRSTYSHMWEAMQEMLWKTESKYSQLYGILLCSPHHIHKKHDSVTDSSNISYLYQWATFFQQINYKSNWQPRRLPPWSSKSHVKPYLTYSRVTCHHHTKNKAWAAAWISHQWDFCCHRLFQVTSLVRMTGGSERVNTWCRDNLHRYLIQPKSWYGDNALTILPRIYNIIVSLKYQDGGTLQEPGPCETKIY
jgi:hypothetical protein